MEMTSWRVPRRREQVRQRLPVGLLVGVVAHRERDVRGTVLSAALDGEQHGDQLGAHGDEAFGVGLGRDDVQQRDQRVGRGRGVVAQRELGELEQLLDPDTGVAQGLDDRPGPERVLLQHGDVRPPTV
jgi:hypothetical protein